MSAGARAPRASIIVPSFDHGPFVLGAVRSALDQTESDLEVIVLDDGSTDDSMERLATLADPRVTVLQHPNRGLSRTLNRGLGMARARWVKFLPSDDMLAPTCIERELAAIDATDVGVVFCLPEVVDAYGHPLADPAPQAWFDTAARDDRSILPGLVERNFLCAPGALFDRELAREVGGFDPGMKVAQDYDLWLRLLARSRARLLPERLVRVRWHGANQSALATPATEAERARALLRAVAPGSRGDWIRRFAGDASGRRARVLGRRAFAGALRRSGVSEVLTLAAEMEREAESLARGGPVARAAGALDAGLRATVGRARRRLRPGWMRGTSGIPARRLRAAGGVVGERGATPAVAPRLPGTAEACPRWIALDPAPASADGSHRLARLAEALDALGASVAFASDAADAGVPADAPGGVRRIPWSLEALRAELDSSPERVCLLVGGPHPLAFAFAREARSAGARVVYDRARAWEKTVAVPWGDPEVERALVSVADDLVAAGREFAGPLAGAGRVVHLLASPTDSRDERSWGDLAAAILHAVRGPTTALLVASPRSHARAGIESLAAAVSRSREIALRPVLLVDASGPARPGEDEAIDADAERARIAVLRCPVAGESAARTLGLRATASEVVVFASPAGAAGLESDGVARAVARLQSDPGVGAVLVAPRSEVSGAVSAGLPRATGEEFEIEETDPGSGSGDAVLVCSRRALFRAGFRTEGPEDRPGADRALVRVLRGAGSRVIRLAS